MKYEFGAVFLPVERVIGGQNMTFFALGSTAPHAETNRITVTPSPGQRIRIKMFAMQICRDAVAAPLGRSFVQLSLGGTIVHRRFHFNNAVSSQSTVDIGCDIPLQESVAMAFNTEDVSTGGTQFYNGWCLFHLWNPSLGVSA